MRENILKNEEPKEEMLAKCESVIQDIKNRYESGKWDLADILPDLEKAGELGIVEAQSMLASYFLYGNCYFICRIFMADIAELQRRDEKKGFYWLKKAMENEDANSIFTYAKYLFFGKINCIPEVNFDNGLGLEGDSYNETGHREESFEYAVKASDLGCDRADVWLMQAAKKNIPGAEEAMRRAKKDLFGMYEKLYDTL